MPKETKKEKTFTLVSSRLQLLRKTETVGKGKKGKFMSQAELADALHLSEMTIKRYENNNPTLGQSTLAYLATFFNTTVAYLSGTTDIKDPLLYYKTLDDAAAEGLSLYETEIQAENERIKNLFLMCGYQYENISGTSSYDFDGIRAPPVYDGPHKLIDPQGINETIYLSDAELENIKQQLGYTVAFECYRIKRGRDKCNGND